MVLLLASLGVFGAAIACGAYLLLHCGQLTPRAYAWANLTSCAFCGLSLFGQFNAGSLLVELFFFVVSAWVIARGREETL